MRRLLSLLLLISLSAFGQIAVSGGIVNNGVSISASVGGGGGGTTINLSGTTTSYNVGSAVVGDYTSALTLTLTNNTGAPFDFYAVYSPIYGAVQSWDISTSWPFAAPVYFSGNYYTSNISNNVGHTPSGFTDANWTLIGASSHTWTTIWYDGDALAPVWNPTSGACHPTPLTGAANAWTGITWTLGAGGTCNLPVYLRPTQIGSSTGHVYLADNAGNILSTITLNGTGTAPTISHSATLPTGITNPLTDTEFSTHYVAPGSCSFTDSTLSGLQSHINAANGTGGQVFCVTAGSVLDGTLTISACPAATDYLTTSAYASLPAAGTRVGPSDASNMFAMTNSGGDNELHVASTACNWRIVGMENHGTFSGGQVLVNIDPAAHDIVFDRNYATWVDSLGTNWMQMEGTRVAVIDSYCYLDNSGETQCIASTNGPGPFKIVNNTLIAPGENYFFGGADSGTFGSVPSDIEIRNNYSTKPLAWNFNCLMNGGGISPSTPGVNPCGATVWDGGGALGITLNTNTGTWSSATAYVTGNVTWRAGDPYAALVGNTNVDPIGHPATWQFLCFSSGCTTSGGGIWRPVKNCGEIKKGQRWLDIGNIYENNWIAGQDGTCKLWETADQSGSDVSAINTNGTFEYNIIRNAGNAMSEIGSSYAYGSRGNSHLVIQNNLVYNIGQNLEWGVPNPNLFVTFGGSTASPYVGKSVPGYSQQHNFMWVSDVVINHNTFLDYTNSILIYDAGSPLEIYGLQMKCNIFSHGSFGLDNAGVIGDKGGNFNSVWPSAQTDLATNVLIGAAAAGHGSDYTANWLLATDVSAVQFTDYANKNLTLTAGSPYHNACGDGKDYGADAATVNSMTSCVVNGVACNPHP